MEFERDDKKKLGSKFIRLGEGDAIEVVLIGVARIRRVKWSQEEKSFCISRAEDANTRLVVNAYCPEDGAVRVLEGPKTLATKLMSATPTDSDVVRIERTGQRSWAIKKVRNVTPDEKEEVQSSKVHDLAAIWVGDDTYVPYEQRRLAGAPTDDDGSDDLPF